MSVTKPEIDTLLEKTELNPFLLCSIASKRACDINDMIRGQHLRVLAIQEVDDITNAASSQDTVALAMDELASGALSYDQEAFDESLRSANAYIL